MVNGYSGLFPKSYLDLNQLMTKFPMPETLDRLSTQGVDYCVVAGPLNDQLIKSSEVQMGRLQFEYSDNQNRVFVYRLRDRENAKERKREG